MRHRVKCPGTNGNADCKTLHDLGNLQQLRRHIENEVYNKKSNDSGHLSVQLDRLGTSNGFRNAEMANMFTLIKRFIFMIWNQVFEHICSKQ